MKQRRRKGIKGLILALASAAVLVPAANGHVYVPSGSETTSPGYTPQALRAMSERYTKMAESYYQHARPDDRGGIRGVGTTAVDETYGGLYPGSGAGPGSTVIGAPDLVDRQLANLDAKAAQVAQSLHVDDRAGIRGPGPIETPAVVSSHSDGFDWTDAGIGASVALVAAVMLAAATVARRRAGLAV
jgi:hypothetical protein